MYTLRFLLSLLLYETYWFGWILKISIKCTVQSQIKTSTLNRNISQSLIKKISIKGTGFKYFKKFLLNVPYDLKNYPLCNYKTSTYNRNHRVGATSIEWPWYR